MAFSFLGGDDPDQLFLLAPDARRWLPRRHVAWQLLVVTSELDLSGFLAVYRADGRSRPAFHPASMLALVMYCYCKGVRSSRAIEMACWDDLGARVIMGNRQPDHATIARFVRRHAEQIKSLLVQTLVIAARDGLLSVDVVAGDGTVFAANASASANATGERLEVEIAELDAVIDAEVASWFAEAAAADAAEQATVDDPAFDAPSGGPGTLVHTVDKLLRRRQAKDRLTQREAQRQAAISAERQARVDKWASRVAAREQAHAAARANYQAKAAGWHARNQATPGGLPGTKPVPVDQNSTVRRARQALEQATARYVAAQAAAAAPIPAPTSPPKANTTDPASRLLPGKHGGYAQGYNVQILTTADQIILDITTHDSPVDTGALHPLLRRGRANLDAAGITTPIGTALFDAGYASDENFTTACPDADTTLLVAVNQESRQTGRRHDPPTRRLRVPSWQQMSAQLATEAGKNLYKKRAATVEPVIGQLLTRLGRRLRHPGFDAHPDLREGWHRASEVRQGDEGQGGPPGC